MLFFNSMYAANVIPGSVSNYSIRVGWVSEPRPLESTDFHGDTSYYKDITIVKV